MITKYRTHPYHSPLNDLLNVSIGRDIGQFFGYDDVATSSPKVNITETPKEFVISMLVPGYAKDKLKITAEKETLTVKAEKSEYMLGENERFTRREFQVGGFTRSFRLPETVDIASVHAEHVDGVLKVHIPRVEPAKPTVRDISIA
ncbi:MAG TPA: Hsp20/alpha crystallin family protein [Flavobacteriales bacterium]|nr:Hsp20/alpha crystallin family protein [Flavobacteriales bacterium]